MATISTSGISAGQIIRSEHLLRVINALNGVNPIDIIITGSLSVSGSTSFTGSTYLKGLPNTSRANVITYDPITGQLSYLNSASLGVTMSVSQPGGSNTQIQYNSGSILAANSSFTFNYLSSSLQNGNNVIANGTFAHAQGNQTTSSGQYSHAEGSTTQAKGLGSHAEGINSIASGSYSHTEGSATIAIGQGSHAEGRATLSTGSFSHTEGEATIALGYAAHAEGLSTEARGDYSHAEGNSTVALGNYQHVQGQFNISSSAESAFIIGNGTSNLNRSNLIFASGSQVQISGSLRVSGSIIGSFTGSLLGTASYTTQALSASWAPTNSTFPFTGSARITGSLIVTGSILTTENITASELYIGNFYSNGYGIGVSDNYDTNYNFLYEPYVGLQITDFASYVFINQDGSITFINSDNANQGNLRANSLTANRQYYLPDLDGTIALTSQIPSSASYATTGSNIFIGNQTITGSLRVSGSITGSLLGTASWANSVTSASFATSASWAPSQIINTGSLVSTSSFNAFTSSYNTGSFTGSFFGTSSWADYATIALYAASAPSGPIATTASVLYSITPSSGFIYSNNNNSIFFGQSAGQYADNAYSSCFLGAEAGDSASNAAGSNFIGNRAGYQAINAQSSNFLGGFAGSGATQAQCSNFLGQQAGLNSFSASFSTIIGFASGRRVGVNSIGSNNIIIGTNITLAPNQKDSINLGGIIFATGSYSTFTGNSFSGSVSNARVGIGTSTPLYTLDISGSTRINDILLLEPRSTTPGSPTNGMVIISGSGADQHIYCYLNSTWKQLD
jgi:hypothetical protein